MAQIRDISKRTALYERLSKDDEQQGESNSILNQKQYLEEYAHKNGFVNIQHFTDDGYTGRNFNRPGFQEMLAEIENGKIGTVIVNSTPFVRQYNFADRFAVPLVDSESDAHAASRPTERRQGQAAQRNRNRVKQMTNQI